MKRKKKAGFFLKIVVLMLAIYTALTLVRLQIELNAQREHLQMLEQQKKELEKETQTLLSFTEYDELSEEDIVRIARDEWGLVMPDEKVIVDTSR